ncbi:MAG TPA: ATP-binding protein [Steroidobacteraceae bacterium]|jgi:signal transduction histidine kinase|nr:ATP-binding protein [Steroidobacteraceae bacterium]
MTETTLRALVLDDNPHDRQLTLRELHKEFPDVEAIEPLDDAEFREALANATFDIVVTDFNLKWANGVDIVRAVKEARPHCPVIMFTATGTQEVAVAAMKAGLDDYVIKSPKHYLRLAVAVRSCLDRAEIRLRALRSETRLYTLLERLNVGVLRMTVEGDVVDANRACKALLDHFEAQTEGSGNGLLGAIRQELPRLTRRNDQAEREVELHAGGGESVCVYLSLLRVRINGHDAVDVLVEDVTKMRRSAERNQELEQANRALEAFAYTVTHDLRAPLRNLQGYVRAMVEDCSQGLGEDCRGYVSSIEQIAVNMDGMIADVLEFSRLARTELPTRRLEVRPAVDEALALLNQAIEARSAKLELAVGPEVSVMAHQQTLVQVLTNLVSNALKFVAEGTPPEVRIRTERRNASRIRLWVEDNGIGIEPAQHGRIFEVFQRLHGEEKYPGTGIGLALVKKGVERMGGQVGVESAPGQGSRFWIELRAAG